jgi:O-antigen/teichoic acid export membrane protein
VCVTAADVPGDDLGRQVVSGARWVLLLRVGSMGTAWIVSIALAHMLDRSEFGIAGLAITFLTILVVFQESGLGAALIHRADRMQEAIDSAVVYAAGACSALALLCLVAAPVVGSFFHQSELTGLVRAIALVFVFRGISTVPQAILQRELRFRAWALMLLSGTFIQGCVAITLAVLGAGAWSVVIGTIALEGWCALLAWPVAGIRADPRRASWRAVRDLLSYGRGVVGANALNSIYTYVDNIVIARTLGPASLGAYTIGYQMGKQPVSTLTSASNALVFSAYSKLRDDPDRFRRAYLRSLRFITVVSAPIGFGFAAVSGTFIHVVYGERWHAAGPVLAIIALMGLVLSVSATMGEVMKASGHPSWLFGLAAAQTTMVTVAVILLYPHGIAAVAAGVAVPVTVIGIVAACLTTRLLAIDRRQWAETLVPAGVSGAVMAAALVGTDHALRSLSPAARLVLEAVEGIVVYCVAFRLVAPARFAEFLGELDRISAFSALHLRLRRALRST